MCTDLPANSGLPIMAYMTNTTGLDFRMEMALTMHQSHQISMQAKQGHRVAECWTRSRKPPATENPYTQSLGMSTMAADTKTVATEIRRTSHKISVLDRHKKEPMLSFQRRMFHKTTTEATSQIFLASMQMTILHPNRLQEPRPCCPLL